MGEVKLGCNNFCTPQRNPIQRSVYRNISLLKHTRHKCAQYMPIFQKVICKLCNQQNDSRRVRSVKFPTNRMVSMNLKVYRFFFEIFKSLFKKLRPLESQKQDLVGKQVKYAHPVQINKNAERCRARENSFRVVDNAAPIIQAKFKISLP